MLITSICCIHRIIPEVVQFITTQGRMKYVRYVSVFVVGAVDLECSSSDDLLFRCVDLCIERFVERLVAVELRLTLSLHSNTRKPLQTI